MTHFKFLTALSLLTVSLMAQNDQDAIRYSQTTFGGTSRSKAMAGSFGALGADGSCMGTNPAGIGLYKKGDINISFGLKFFSVNATHNGTTTNTLKASVPFDGLTLVGAWYSKKNPDNHHSLGFGCNQIANYNSNFTVQGMSNKKSITQDMLATAKNTSIDNLDQSFAGLGFNSLVLDTINGPKNYYSFVNTKYDLEQGKNVKTTGRINDYNINYAYGYKDKLYLGASLGIASVNYNYSSTYTEKDINDSMRLIYKATPTPQVSGTYNYDVYYYQGFGGFKQLDYKEDYKTTGTGVNLKLGAIYRATDFMRFGASFVSPTIYTLTDAYIYKLETVFDGGNGYKVQSPDETKFPNGGKFNYRIITPMKLTGSVAFLYKKIATLNIDYDYMDYRKASLQDAASSNSSSTVSSSLGTFSGANSTIKAKYSSTSNLRVGGEVNLKPVFVRLGYAMYGSPFGDKFSGDFVKTYYTGGVGFRKDKFYVDVSFTKMASNENYYMYNPNYVDKSTLRNSGTTIAVSIGSKF